MLVRSRDGASRRRMLLLQGLLVATAAVALGIAARVVTRQSLDTAALLWNLFLAWVPFVLALALYDGARRGAGARTLLLLGGLWLLFLPNAPYIVTDAKWLGNLPSGTYWHDPLLIGSAAALGLVLGFCSLYLVQAVVARRLGRVVGWGLAAAALVLSGVGVYLGRYERWNSWEVLTEPTKIFGGLASGVLDPLAHERPLVLSALFATVWCVGYLLFYSLFRPQLRRLEEH